MRLAGFLLFMVFATTSVAEVRVLIRFDSSGHHVHRVYSIQSNPVYVDRQRIVQKQLTSQNLDFSSRRLSVIESARRPTTLFTRSFKGTASNRSVIHSVSTVRISLQWFDDNNQVLAVTEAPDPRIVHNAASQTGTRPSYTSVQQGAWLAAGPTGASRVDIVLPENTDLGLGGEFWSLELSSP